MYRKLNIIINIILIMLGCFLTGLAFLSKFETFVFSAVFPYIGYNIYMIFPMVELVFSVLLFIKLYFIRGKIQKTKKEK